jgi:Ca2+-binding EF-hand superfamily protein
LNEFIAMHKYLQAMRDSFMFFDRDRSNSLDTNELLQALNRAGYNISQPALMAALPKFDKDRNGTLGFDEFLDLCIYLSNIRKLFSFYDPQNTGRITLTFDQLFACSPYFQ